MSPKQIEYVFTLSDYSTGDHLFRRHVDCEVLHCRICDGGLLECVICGEAEGGLEATCPGPNLEEYNGG
jgi:hypothetical protein